MKADFLENESWIKLIQDDLELCVADLFHRAITQEAVSGVRETRWIIVGGSYVKLNFIKDLLQKEFVKLTGAFSRVGGSFKLSDDTKVSMEFTLVTAENISKVKANQCTGAFMVDVGDLAENVLYTLICRAGRFPASCEGRIIISASGQDFYSLEKRLTELSTSESFPSVLIYRYCDA